MMTTRSKSKKFSTAVSNNSEMSIVQANSSLQTDDKIKHEQTIQSCKKKRSRNKQCTISTKRRRTRIGALPKKEEKECPEEIAEKRNIRDILEKIDDVDELPYEVAKTNPLADKKLVGKYILLDWPVGPNPIWYGCRVLHFDEAAEMHTVMYGYGDEEWSIEYVKLNQREWRLVAVDPCAGMWARSESMESKIGRIVYIRPNEADTEQQTLAKKALILGIVGQFRGSTRQGKRFNTSGPETPKYLIMWIHDGLFEDGPDGGLNNQQGIESGQLNEVRQLAGQTQEVAVTEHILDAFQCTTS